MPPRFRLPPYIVHDQFTINELQAGLTWPITDYLLQKVWETFDGSGVKVGVCDTGVSGAHVSVGELKGVVESAQDFSGSRTGVEDKNGHGTHVASIIAGRRDDEHGLAGVAPGAKLYMAKVLGDTGSGGITGIVQGMNWCAERGCHVINLSLGSGSRSEELNRAIVELNRRGVIVVAAAGNSGKDNDVSWPARQPETVSVASINKAQGLSRFSSRGPQNDTCAPGEEILAAYRDGSYATLSGTSMAAPWLSGIVALLLQAGLIRRNADSVREWISHNSVDLGPGGHDPGYGHGVPDTGKIRKGTTPNPDPPNPPPLPPPPPPPPREPRRILIEGTLREL